MIAIEYHRGDLMKPAVRSGFISAAAILLILLLALEPQFGLASAFVQEQNNTPVTASNTTSNVAQIPNSTQVGFVSNIEQIRGHLNAAVMNKEAGNNTLALAHTLHPIAEIYSSIEPQISRANTTLNETLSTNLNQLSQIVKPFSFPSLNSLRKYPMLS